ncbi:MAG TPA: nuclear transport factor 2 family protein [Nitrososphaeraceae archaeon]|jgi:ketosteroid isomerase-like protein|nr:nuclear transport factor 2 family protein [Thermoproteota archaeon]HJR47138.1 nuclear transport factor 2 family protein [Nitrososphaeraceae archaeon]
MSKITEQTIQDINIQFYKAFESLSLERMEQVWKHSDDVVCVHPGWDLFRGWTAVRESWMTIFQNTERIQFIITNAKVRAFENIVAVVVCLENIETIINQDKIRMGVIATNIFERQRIVRNDEDEWLMIHHHGSPVSNYMPPNVSV